MCLNHICIVFLHSSFVFQGKITIQPLSHNCWLKLIRHIHSILRHAIKPTDLTADCSTT